MGKEAIVWFLMVVVIINFALTIWILKVMDFSTVCLLYNNYEPKYIWIKAYDEFLKLTANLMLLLEVYWS